MPNRSVSLSLALAAGSVSSCVQAQEKLHFTYLWHMEQPIYWPDASRAPGASGRYENAWESIQRTDAGARNPENNLREIFSKPDRVAAYQDQVPTSISIIDWAPEAGAQMSFSGGLLKNLESIGNAGQLGYSPSWNQPIRNARSWRTAGASKPRLDIVNFSFHHALLPLVADSTVRKEIQAYRHVYQSFWGSAAPISRGFFPSEMAFSTRLIPILAEEGVAWSIVSAEKISRATEDFPVVFGSGGINCDPPNRADMVNPAQGDYYRVQISRGCAPAEAYPFALTPHRVQAVDPATDPMNPDIKEIIAIPASQSISWEDGANPIGTSHFDALQTLNDPARPMLVTLAHDGDNFFAGGFSYYREATPNLVSSAQAKGYHATVVEEYLADHPVPTNDIVHVEDGAWVNADGDFGSPQFWNWNYPPVNAQGQVDIENGWAEDIRNWAVITAAQNYVDTAEQVAIDAGQQVNIGDIITPNAGTSPTERAWHFFLGALNSGYMYYGTALDFEVKPSIACNEAISYATPVINSGVDRTGPSVWIPQRWPWNPGELNFGSPYGYRPTVTDTDFHVWTFAHDVSGVQSVTLKYRVDADGFNPLSDWQNETYAGGPAVGAWQELPMTARVFPAGNVLNDGGIDFFEMPDAIADQYYAQITGLTDTLVDYYVEAVDAEGNVERSAIQHVWIGDGEGAVDPGGERVVLTPETPIAGEPLTVSYDPAGGPLAGAANVQAYWGINGWSPVISEGSPMAFDGEVWTTNPPLALPDNAESVQFVFNNGDGVWDNNNGQDWSFAVEGATNEPPAFALDGSLDDAYTLVAQNAGVELHAGYDNGTLFLAGTPAGAGAVGGDRFVLIAENPGPLQGAMWGKAGQVAAWDAFVGNEESNGFNGWFDQDGPAATSLGAYLEASINLDAEMPGADAVYLAIASYASPDGGSLLSQAPAGDNDADLEAAEWVRVELASITPGEDCPADVNADGTLNGADFNAWLAAFSQGLDIADQNNDGMLNGADFNAWLANFAAGC